VGFEMNRKMINNSPPITVLMATYNDERFIGEAITSVLSQTMPDFEFFIIDDASTDRTPSIVSRYMRHDNRICLIRNKENLGLTKSLNIGLKRARGEYVARMDGDDLCESHRLERQIAFVSNHPEVLLLGSGCKEIDDTGRCIKVHRYPVDHSGLVRRLERQQAFFAHSSAFYKTSVVRQLGGYRLRFKRAQDWDLWLRLCEKGKVSSISTPLVRIRKHQNQISLSERGRRQLVDGHAATVSYFVRKWGGKDPVVDVSDIKARQFFDWIEEQLNYAGVFALRKSWSEARAAYFAQPNRLIGILRFGEKFLRSGHALLLLKDKVFGTDLPKRLAQKWIKSSSA
jgi:glycosyltransferase involved in cell wall biosynthesis